MQDRLGIRVRAMELPNQKNRTHRVKSELDAVLYSLYRIPWYVPVFIATDSEYVQQNTCGALRRRQVSSRRSLMRWKRRAAMFIATIRTR